MTRRLVGICVPVTFFLLLVAYFNDDGYNGVERPKYLSPKRHYVSTQSDEDDLLIDNSNVAFEAYQSELRAGRKEKQKLSREGDEIGKIWVSMSVCFSENTQLYEKKNYPYAAVTPLAVLLWKHFSPENFPLGLLVQVVYVKEKTFANVLEGYAATLRQAGAVVRLVAAEEGVDCPLQSQLVRLFAFNDPEVNDGDVVVTMDVNAFVVAEKVFSPILENPGLLAWVYQYHDTAHIRNGKGTVQYVLP